MGLSIALLYGGVSREREVSVRTGNAIANSLKKLGHTVHLFDARPGFEEQLRSTAVDVAVIAMHGSPGEDGIIQGILEFMGIPYTGTGVAGSALAMDKLLSKRLFLQAGLATPTFHAVGRERIASGDVDGVTIHVRDRVGVPLVVKPIAEGSSVGLEIVHEEGALRAAIERAFTEGIPFLVEKYVAGDELTVGILGNPGSPLPVIRIRPKSGVYDYRSKYTRGETEFEVPAKMEQAQTRRVQEMALAAYRSLDCRDFARIDLMMDGDGQPWLLEVNTIPGMTETSLLPQAAGAIGVGFDELCELMLQMALKRKTGVRD